LVSAAFVGLSACSSSGGGTDTLVVQIDAGQPFTSLAAAWVKIFEKRYPGVHVQLQQVTSTQSDGSNLQVLTSSDAPDVALLPLESPVFAALSQGGQLLDLSDVRKASSLASRYDTSALSVGLYNNVPYALPYGDQFYNVVYYNKTLFQKLGIEPTNHRIDSVSQLLHIVAVLKSKGVQGLGLGVADDYPASWLIDGLLPTATTAAQYQNYLTNWQKGVPETVKYTDPPFVDSLARVKELADDGVFQTGFMGATVSSAEALFEQGKVGMVLDGSWQAPVYTTDHVSFAIDWALMPPLESGRKSVLTSYLGDSFGIPVRAKNPQMAKKWLETIASVAGQEVLPQYGYLPLANDVPSSYLAKLDPLIQSMAADTRANGVAIGWSNVVSPKVGATSLEPIEQAMMQGNSTPQSVGAQVQTALQALRS
jgi:ABC-type glycerol-3-phosphate transport system substrate-binding protein